MAAYCCDNCNGLMVVRGVIEDTDDHPAAFKRLERLPVEEVSWYPRHIKERKFIDVPAHIASAASEAYKCLAIGANRAAIAITRAVVEATAKDRGITGGSIVTKIDEMRARDLIRPITHEGAHEVRHWGNDMAHGDFVQQVGAEEAEAVLGLMTEVLQEVYQGPAALAKITAIRQARRP